MIISDHASTLSRSPATMSAAAPHTGADSPFDLEHLAEIPLFEGIPSQSLALLFGCLSAHEAAYRKGEVIYLEQDRIRNIGIVREGSVAMTKEDMWGGRTILATMSRNELIGETFAVNYSQLSYVTFTAETDCRLLFLSFQHLLHTCQKSCSFHHRIIENLMNLISQKNILLMEKIEVTSRPTLRQKILAYLSLQAQKQSSNTVTIPLDREELAAYLDANRSAMTRELSAMREEGILDFHGRVFSLH